VCSSQSDSLLLSSHDDGKLVRMAAAGNREAWDALVARFGSLVWSVARAHGLADTDARDVSQNTWLHLIEHIDSLREPKRVSTWLATTARRESLRVLRSCRRDVPTDGELMPEEPVPAEAEDRLLTAERDRAVRDAFERLPPDDQALLRMLVVEPPLSYREISAALDMPIGSIGPTRARCLRRLHRQLHRVGGQHGMLT